MADKKKLKGILALTETEAIMALQVEYDKDCGPGAWEKVPVSLKFAMAKSYALGFRDGVSALAKSSGGSVEIEWREGGGGIQ